MRLTQRHFVVEYKGSRRRAINQTNSIWGDTDLKTLAREAEADAPQLFAGEAASVCAKAFEPTPIAPVAAAVPLAIETFVSPRDEMHQTPKPVEGVTAVHVENGPSNRSLTRRVKRRAAKKNPPQIVDTEKHLVNTADPVVPSHWNDDLDYLDAENRRLKATLTEHLRRQNDRLRSMLARFD